MLRRAFLSALMLMAFAAPSARAQVKLEYKYPEGTKSSYKTSAKTHQILSIMGMDVETEDERSIVTSASIGKRNADGTLPIARKIESFQTQLTLPGGLSVNFDSANPDAKIENEQLAFLGDVYRAIVGVQYTVVLDEKNKVKFVQGAEGVQTKIDALKGNAAEALRGVLSTEKLKRSFEQEHANLPDVLARKGEPWEHTQVLEIGGGQTLSFRKSYEYLGTQDKDGKTFDKIGVKALSVNYEMDPNTPSPLKVTKSDLKIDSAEGSFLFDRERGEMAESHEKTRIKGTLTITAGDKELPSTLDLTLDVASQRMPAGK